MVLVKAVDVVADPDGRAEVAAEAVGREDLPGLEAGVNDTASEGVGYVHAITLANLDPEPVQVVVNWGDGSANQTQTTSAQNPIISHVYADNGTYTVTVTATDQGIPSSNQTDTYQVTTSDGGPAVQQRDPGFVVDGEPGDRICITVTVNREGKTGSPSGEKCADLPG